MPFMPWHAHAFILNEIFFLLSGEYCNVPAEYREKVVNFASTYATRLRALYLQGNV